MSDLAIMINQAIQTIQDAPDLSHLEKLRVQLLGKNGDLTHLLKTLGSLPPEERRAHGQKINAAKEQVTTL